MIAPAKVPPLIVKVSTPVPPVRVVKAVNVSALVLVNVPAFVPVIDHALVRFGPVSVLPWPVAPVMALILLKPVPVRLASVPAKPSFVPTPVMVTLRAVVYAAQLIESTPVPVPPSMLATVKLPENTKLSVLLPPTTFWILLKPPVTPVTVPALFAVIFQVFATLPPVSVLVPPPPLIAPVNVPPLRVKVSEFVPPVRFGSAAKVKTPLIFAFASLPAFGALTVHVFAIFDPRIVPMPPPFALIVGTVNVGLGVRSRSVLKLSPRLVAVTVEPPNVIAVPALIVMLFPDKAPLVVTLPGVDVNVRLAAPDVPDAMRFPAPPFPAITVVAPVVFSDTVSAFVSVIFVTAPFRVTVP